MVGMRNSNVSEKIKCQKINKYFYKSPEGKILKYSHYCIEKNCKTESSYNYENLKPIYCVKHKLEKMVNVKRGHKLCKDCETGYLNKCNTPKCKYTIKNYKNSTRYMKLKIIKYLKENYIAFYMCRICSEIVDKEHFFTEEHINKFNSACKIKIDKSLEESFITIKCKFIDTRYNYIYTDLYFKKHIKDIILKNINTNKFYKSYIHKKNILEFNQGKRDPMYISERHDSNDILYDIENIEHLEENKERNLKPYLIKYSSMDYDYKIKKMYQDIDKVNFKESGNSIYYINSSGCDIHILECELLKGSNYKFENIPKIFYNSKVVSVIKNKDEKCFIYNYIRKFLNNVNKHQDRVSLKDKEIVKKLEEELNFNFDNVKIKDLSKIENLLETNIYVYSCDKNLKNRLPVYKSDKNYEKYLDLLLYEEHYMNIKNISRFFYPNDKNKIYFCRNCCNKMYSDKKFIEHQQFCENNKTQLLLPSQNKYLQFKNLQNTIQHNFICYADIESQMIFNDNVYEHEHLMSGYYLHCIDPKYSKKVKLFDNLEDFRDNLINELDYIKNINKYKLNFDIDMNNFNKKEFNKVEKCKHCNQKFNEDYNNRKISLIEKVDKYKLQRIIDDFDNNDINEETQQNLKKYYESLDKNGEIEIIYRQNFNTGRYYANQFSLQNMYNIVRSSIIHKDSIDIDFINSNITIIIYLAEKYKLKIPNIKKYSNDRENILKKINDDRSIAKKLILAILNGGFTEKYHDDKNINKFLKDIENESKMLHEYFYKIDKRIDDEKIFNYKGKNFSRILQDYENMLLMNLYDYFQIKKIKMMVLIFDGILLLPDQQINIHDIESYLIDKTNIPMKISIKPFKDHFQKFGEPNINIKDFKKSYKNICYINKKVIHHNHSKKENNIIDYICNNCNLKIKNSKELIVLFHNAKGYDNSYMLDIFSKIPNIQISCLGQNTEKFKMLKFLIPEKDYSIKIIDSLAFLQSNLNDLSKDLDDNLKIITKNHFQDKFGMVNKKLDHFPYNYVNKNNLEIEELPDKKHFYNMLKLKDITDKEYKLVKKFYENMKFKNLRKYLECYLISDITLLADVFNNFRKIIFDNLGLDPVKYISAPSLTKDCALKYSKAKIENIKDVSIFQFVRKSVMGGLSNSISPYLKIDNENESIVYNDISSQYPYELSKKLPVSNYKFVENFDENKYGQDKDYNCILLCDVKTTDLIKNDCLYNQCPMLVSKCKITDKNLSEYQLKQIKNKRDNENSNYKSQSEKLITNLGNDSNTYLNFEMYQMFKQAGYDIEIKKILEFKHEAIFENYIKFLYSKKKEYALQKKKSMELCFKIMMNSFYGSTLTDKTKFKDIKICTTKSQALKLTKKPNFNSFNIINENLVIIEMSKNKCIFDSPILIGSQILFNSKCNLYNYMYNIIPELFGKENIIYSLRDTDSIVYKIKNCSYEKYLETLKNNKNLFDKELGLMENELDENIKEIISLRSKCYSILTVNNNHSSKAKSISKNYCKKNHTHKYFKKVLNNNINNKAEFYRISLKNGKLQTVLQLKDDINNFNDKRHMINNLISKPHEINL